MCFYFRPFGSCAEVLTTSTVEKYFLPVIVSNLVSEKSNVFHRKGERKNRKKLNRLVHIQMWGN